MPPSKSSKPTSKPTKPSQTGTPTNTDSSDLVVGNNMVDLTDCTRDPGREDVTLASTKRAVDVNEAPDQRLMPTRAHPQNGQPPAKRQPCSPEYNKEVAAAPSMQSTARSLLAQLQASSIGAGAVAPTVATAKSAATASPRSGAGNAAAGAGAAAGGVDDVHEADIQARASVTAVAVAARRMEELKKLHSQDVLIAYEVGQLRVITNTLADRLKALEADLKTNTQADRLKALKADLKAEVGQLQAITDTLADRLNAMEAATLADRLKALEADLKRLADCDFQVVRNTDAKMNGINSTIGTILGRLDAMERQQQQEQSHPNWDAIVLRLQQQEERLVALKSDHDALKSDHDALKSDHDTLKSDHDTLKKEHAELKKERDTFMQEMERRLNETCEQEKAARNADMNLVKQLISVYDARICRHDQRLANMSDNLSSLADEVLKLVAGRTPEQQAQQEQTIDGILLDLSAPPAAIQVSTALSSYDPLRSPVH